MEVSEPRGQGDKAELGDFTLVFVVNPIFPDYKSNKAGMMVQVYNPSYSGGRDREDHLFQVSLGQKKKNQLSQVWWCTPVASAMREA
jgi:hypothetical protein